MTHCNLGYGEEPAQPGAGRFCRDDRALSGLRRGAPLLFDPHPEIGWGVPEQTFDATLRALKKGDIAPVYYLVGAEDLLKTDLARDISDRVLDPALRDFNFDQRTATSLDPEELSTLLNTLPMMAERRVVILRDVEGWQKQIPGQGGTAPLSRPAGAGDRARHGAGRRLIPTPTVEIAPHAVTVSCDPLPPDRALRWIIIAVNSSGSLCTRSGGAPAAGGGQPAHGARRRTRRSLPRLPPARRSPVSSWANWSACAMERRCSTGGTRFSTTRRPGRSPCWGPCSTRPAISGVKLVSLLGTSAAGVSLARATATGAGAAVRSRATSSAADQAGRLYGLSEWKAEAVEVGRWSARWPTPGSMPPSARRWRPTSP